MPVLNRGAIYAKLASLEEVSIKRLIKLIDSNNESVSLGAVKLLLNKILPDIRSVEFKLLDQQINNFTNSPPLNEDWKKHLIKMGKQLEQEVIAEGKNPNREEKDIPKSKHLSNGINHQIASKLTL